MIVDTGHGLHAIKDGKVLVTRLIPSKVAVESPSRTEEPCDAEPAGAQADKLQRILALRPLVRRVNFSPQIHQLRLRGVHVHGGGNVGEVSSRATCRPSTEKPNQRA
jgi:hypothetical protein